MKNLAVVFGGPSPEHDISILTGLQAGRLLGDAGNAVRLVYWARDGRFLLVPNDLEASDFTAPDVRGAGEVTLDVARGFVERRRVGTRSMEVDVVVNCCHGGAGEDGVLAGALAAAGQRVTGPGAATSALAMDKIATAAVAAQLDIPVIASVLVDDSTEGIPFHSPWVVKPRFGGSSLGVEADIADLDTVKALARQGACRSGAVVQPFLKGWVDLNVAVRRYPTLQVSEIERPLREDDAIYGFSDKYLGGAHGMESAARELPAVVPEGVGQRMRAAAAALAAEMAISGIPRIDFLWDPSNDSVVLCEVNAIPGALGLYLWEASGVSRAQVLEDLVAEADARGGRPAHWTVGTDHAALRSATSIATKLA